MPKKLLTFLDTSVILAGLNSPTGAAGVILTACLSGKITPIISLQVIEEAERNIRNKFPRLLAGWQSFLLLPPKVAKEPSASGIRKAYKLLPTSDAAILAAAIKAKPDVLVTWDYDFLSVKLGTAVPFPILLPGQFLSQFLKKIK